jgi:beta-aspartyl-peptidase (threonine type)
LTDYPVRPVVVIHAGAGPHSQVLREREAECRAALMEALRAAQSALPNGAVRAVEAATVVMENFELFNAGRGSVLCSDGSVEMSAAVMRGTDQAAGAVAGLRHSENPILAAHAILGSPQVLVLGPPAEERAALAGVLQQPNEYFITERQRARLREVAEGPAEREGPAGREGLAEREGRAERESPAERDPATVGAVCLDSEGVLAAATSTGGIRNQPPGRVGDCPIIGAGTWADRWAAISCTGEGEAFIRCAAAREVAALVRYGVELARAAERALEEVKALRASGGLIAIDADGNVAMPYITPAMPRGLCRQGEEPEVWIP